MDGKMDTDAQQMGRPVSEWVFSGISGVMVAGLILFLGYQALFGADTPAELEVTIERMRTVDNGTMVMVALVNRGDEAAAAVTVNATADGRTGNAAAKQIEFDYIAAHAIRRGAFLFPPGTTPDMLTIEIGGYAAP
ncbi:hypothetical protein [Niveispirillum fermenti]|uniref:hypothetical protein n=1 Tax=Niveispirillum fermenti TaxID=1233113 RepID=UPI003A86DF40